MVVLNCKEEAPAGFRAHRECIKVYTSGWSPLRLRNVFFGNLQSAFAPFLSNFEQVGDSTFSGNIFHQIKLHQLDIAHINLRPMKEGIICINDAG